MIILRQRLYTRNDVRVLKELHQATSGFRKLPKGMKGLTTRDFYRMDKLSKDLYNGSGVDWEDFKTVATHLDLPETAKYGRHAFEKFSNPELIERYKSIRAHKMGLGKELGEIKRLKQEHDALTKSLKKAEEALRKSPGKESYREREATKKALKDWEISNKKYYDTLSDTLRNKLDIQGYPELNKKIIGRNVAGYQKEVEDLKKTMAELPKNSALAERMVGDIKKSGVDVIEAEAVPGNIAMYRPYTNTVEVVKGKDQPAVLGHEWGHAKWFKRMRRVNGFEPELSDNPLYDLPNEAGASLEAYSDMMRRVKQGTATALDLANVKKLLDTAGKQYYRAGMMETAAYIPGRLQDVPRNTRIDFNPFL